MLVASVVMNWVVSLNPPSVYIPLSLLPVCLREKHLPRSMVLCSWRHQQRLHRMWKRLSLRWQWRCTPRYKSMKHSIVPHSRMNTFTYGRWVNGTGVCFGLWSTHGQQACMQVSLNYRIRANINIALTTLRKGHEFQPMGLPEVTWPRRHGQELSSHRSAACHGIGEGYGCWLWLLV